MPQTKTKITQCAACNGGGLVAVGNKVQHCPACGGAGQVPDDPGFPVPFSYVFDLTINLPGSTSGSVLKQISNEADFEWLSIMGTADSARIKLLLEDKSSNFPFSSDPVNFNNFVGSAQLPALLVEPYTFGKNTQLKITATDNGSGLIIPLNAQIVLAGYLRVKAQGVGSQSPPASESLRVAA